MKMTLVKRGKDVDEDMATDINFVSLLKRGEIHYVSLALPGLDLVSHCVEFGGGFASGSDWARAERGTLAPREYRQE